jgi:hypothetical protein
MAACFAANAQYRRTDQSQDHGDYDSGNGLSINADYDAPLAKLANNFKPATNFGLSFKTFGDNRVSNVSIGYEVFNPKAAGFPYAVSDGSTGTETYSDFKAFSLVVGTAYNIKATEQFWIYGGLNAGAYFTHLNFQAVDKYSTDNEDLSGSYAHLAPKLGLTVAVSTNILLSLETRYNLIARVGSNSSQTSTIGTTSNSADKFDSFTLYNSVSTGLSFTYKFN